MAIDAGRFQASLPPRCNLSPVCRPVNFCRGASTKRRVPLRCRLHDAGSPRNKMFIRKTYTSITAFPSKTCPLLVRAGRCGRSARPAQRRTAGTRGPWPGWVPGEGNSVAGPFDGLRGTSYNDWTVGRSAIADRQATPARGSREPGQALIGAALTGATLCGGRLPFGNLAAQDLAFRNSAARNSAARISAAQISAVRISAVRISAVRSSWRLRASQGRPPFCRSPRPGRHVERSWRFVDFAVPIGRRLFIRSSARDRIGFAAGCKSLRRACIASGHTGCEGALVPQPLEWAS
jgi:hypothetical protein